MGKRSGDKKSKLNGSAKPFASSVDRVEREKEAEELELEERLFGTKKRRIQQDSIPDSGIIDEEADAFIDTGDDDLFTIDAPIAADGGSELDYEDGDDISVDDNESDDDDRAARTGVAVDGDDGEEEGEGESDAEFDAQSTDSQVEYAFPDDQYDYADHLAKEEARKLSERKCVWHDPADDLIGVDLNEVRRLKKMARGKRENEGKVGGQVLAGRLREQFERLHPRPAWADNRLPTGTPSLASLFSSTKSFIDNPASGSRRAPLPQGTVSIQRLRNANHQNPTTGKKRAENVKDGVVDFAWHPNPSVPVGAVSGGDKRIRFFHIDGETNPTLLTLHIPSLPVRRTSYHPSGSSLLITGSRQYYYTYDLVAQKCLRSSRNLFGTKPSPGAPGELTRHAFSPDGSLLAVAGRRGAVSILDWSAGGGTGAVVAELVSGRGGGTTAVQWGEDGGRQTLEVLGGRTGNEIEIWDVGARKIISKVQDERMFGAKIMKRSRDGAYTAIGSETGIVNLYSSSSFSVPPNSGHDRSISVPVVRPDPVKSLEHLTTEITSMDIHPSGEMLAIGSKYKPKAFKMLSLPQKLGNLHDPALDVVVGDMREAMIEQ